VSGQPEATCDWSQARPQTQTTMDPFPPSPIDRDMRTVPFYRQQVANWDARYRRFHHEWDAQPRYWAAQRSPETGPKAPSPPVCGGERELGLAHLPSSAVHVGGAYAPLCETDDSRMTDGLH